MGKIILATIILVSLVACSQASLPASKVSVEEKIEKETTVSPAEAGWQARWQNLITAAKKEGKVVVYGGGGPLGREVLIRGMMDNFGLKAEVLTLKTEPLVARVNSERRAGLFLSDIYIGAPITAVTGLKPNGYLEKLDESILFPDINDPKIWYEERLPYTDKDQTIFAFSAFLQGSLAINTNLVKIEEIKSWFDLLEPKWKGRIIIPDPTLEGSMQTSFAAVGLKIINWDYWKSFVKQEPIIIRDQRLIGEWLANGKYPIALGMGSIYRELKNLGAPIQELVMKEGIYITNGAGALSLFKNAPHPNSARVLINWLLSKEGQTNWAKGQVNQSARLDVPVFSEYARLPGETYVDMNTEEFLLRRNEFAQKAREIFSPLLK